MDGSGHFEGPICLDIDIKGNLYTAELERKRVQVCTPQGEFIRVMGCPGPATRGEARGLWDLDGVWGVKVDHEGNVIVADQTNSRVQIYDNNGEYLMGLWNDLLRSPRNAILDPRNQNIVIMDEETGIHIWG